MKDAVGVSVFVYDEAVEDGVTEGLLVTRSVYVTDAEAVGLCVEDADSVVVAHPDSVCTLPALLHVAAGRPL